VFTDKFVETDSVLTANMSYWDHGLVWIMFLYIVLCDLFCFFMVQRELLLGGGEESTARRRNLQYVLGVSFGWD